MSLELGVPDALALACALAAVAFDQRRRPRRALALAVVAVLAKESILLVLLGYAWWRRDRRGLLLAGVPAAVAAAWWAALAVALAGTPNRSLEFHPIVGLVASTRSWLHGNQPVAGAFVLGALVLGAVALVRAPKSVFSAVVASQMVFVAMLDENVLWWRQNGPRAALPLLVSAMLSLAAADRMPRPQLSRPRAALASTR
jgi:hypothetical protein